MFRFLTALILTLVIGLLSGTAHAQSLRFTDDWRDDPRLAIYQRGQDYRFGTQVDFEKSLAVHLQAAKADYAPSQYAVGWLYGFEEALEPDYERSLYWFLKVTEEHETFQVPKYRGIKVQAEKALKKFCKMGVVDFPETHPYANDPKCWLKRGNRLFSGRDWIGERLGYRSSGVERDYVKARLYLENAYNADQREAAHKLWKIYAGGHGTPRDPIKAGLYRDAAAKLGNARASLSLADEAKSDGRMDDYIGHLLFASQQNTSGSSFASLKLGEVYLKGQIVPRDTETAMMHSLLGGKQQYFRGRKLTFPWENKHMIAFLREPDAGAKIEAAKARADAHIKDYDLSSRRADEAEHAYQRAVTAHAEVQRTGGHWYKDQRWWLYLAILLMVGILHGAMYMRRR